jgi:hypothetical protein
MTTEESRTVLYTCPSSSSRGDESSEQFTFYTCCRDFGRSGPGRAATGTGIMSSNGGSTTSTLMMGAESAASTSFAPESATVSSSLAAMMSSGTVMRTLRR